MTFHDRFQRILDRAISARYSTPFPPGSAQLRVISHCFLGAKRGSEVATCTGAPDGEWLEALRLVWSGSIATGPLVL